MEGNNDKSEVLNDFKSALNKIDFGKGYNPESADFDLALKLGLMWRLLCKLDKKPESNSEEKKETDDDISEMIFLTKKYLQKYIDSYDSSYKEMATDLIRHATILLKKANAKLPTGDEKIKLKNYETEIAEIQKQIEKV